MDGYLRQEGLSLFLRQLECLYMIIDYLVVFSLPLLFLFNDVIIDQGGDVLFNPFVLQRFNDDKVVLVS